MNLLDLFSGIGGFSLGLERAGFTTVAFCELDPHCRLVLRKHWPHVPIYDDVRALTADRLAADGIDRVDAVCGGFPCQDVSAAGTGAGLDGERSGLWREFARLVGELRPRFALVENVGALRGRGLTRVLADLAALGFDAQWHAVPAACVGAPHLRDRVWIVAALAADPVRPGLRQAAQEPGEHPEGGRCEADGQAAADPDGEGPQVERAEEHAGQQCAPRCEPHGLGTWGWWSRSLAADSPGPRHAQLRGLHGQLAAALTAASAPWSWPAEPALCRVDDGIPAGLDRRARRAWVRIERQRIKQLGNTVVPLMPELIGRCLME